MTYIAQTNSITFGNIVLDSMPTTLGASNQVLAMNAADNAIVWSSGGTASGIGTVTSVSSSDNSLTITNGSTAVNAIVNAAHTTNYTVPLNTSKGYEISGATALTVSGSAIIVGPNSSIINIGSGANTTGANSIAIGNLAGNTGQLTESIALGDHAGQISQGAFCTALAGYAGNSNQHNYCVAVGYGSGATNQGTEAVALGAGSGATNQGLGSIALGYSAGNANLGIASIAVGLSCNVLGDAGFNTMIGYLNTIPSGSTNSSSLGANSAILTSNEIVLGNGSVVDIRSGSSGLCSLGTTTFPFKSIYVDQINGTDIGTVTSVTSSDNSLTITSGSTAANLIVNPNHTTNYTVPLNATYYEINGEKALTFGGTGYDDTSVYVGNLSGRFGATNTGNNNVFVGYGSGNSVTSASFNVGVGRLSLNQLTTGTLNTSINGGLNQLTTGSANTTVGYDSFGTLVSGNFNTGLGENSGLKSLTSNNVAIGYASGYSLDVGDSNTLCGSRCFGANQTDTSNGMSNITALGANISCVTGVAWTNSILLGNNAILSASNQCVIGNTATNQIIPGSSGIASLGTTGNGFDIVYTNAVSSLHTGRLNIPSVTDGDFMATLGNSQTFTQPLNTNKNFQINGNNILIFGGTGGLDTTSCYIGPLAGNQTTSLNNSSYNICIGSTSGISLSTGHNNKLIGENCGTNISTGFSNTLIGQNSGSSLVSGSFNVGIGYESLQNLSSTGTNCVAIGANAVTTPTGILNITAVGAGAGYTGATNYLTALGFNAAYQSPAIDCTCLGAFAGYNTLGGSSVAIGYNCLPTATGNTTTGIGANITVASNGLSNSSALGASSKIIVSNEIVLGNSAVTNIRCGNTGLACSLGSNGYDFGGIYGQNYYVNNGSGVRTQVYSAQSGAVGYTLALPSLSGNDTIAALGVTGQTFTKTNNFSGILNVNDGSTGFNIKNYSDSTKAIKFDCSGNVTGNFLTLASNQTTSKSLAIPDVAFGDTIATRGSANSFTGANIFSNLNTFKGLNFNFKTINASTYTLDTGTFDVYLFGAYITTGTITVTLPTPTGSGRFLIFAAPGNDGLPTTNSNIVSASANIWSNYTNGPTSLNNILYAIDNYTVLIDGPTYGATNYWSIIMSGNNTS